MTRDCGVGLTTAYCLTPLAMNSTSDRFPIAKAPETFFQAQKRNRRATWRMSALCLFAAFVMGIPLTLVLTPLLYAVTMALAEVINHFSPLPPEFWERANDLTRLAYRLADALINHRGVVDPQEFAIAAVLILVPGIVVGLGLWAGILLLFRHGGVGGTIASLNARGPNPTDLKELQVADTVQEMAIAAGLPAPKVMLVDAPGANAAAIGTSAADAHIVLSRRLLDDLNREQLQALVGHLVSSVGNGDLRIAFTVTSVFETCGLIVTLINSPFGSRSRSTLWRILRYTLRRGSPETRAADAEEVAELLADMLETNSTDIDRFFNSRNPGLIRKFFRLLLFPFLLTNLAVELTLWFFLNVLLGPCMALLWRTRRYLADAGSVELTRNPDALASALQQLSQDNTEVAGGGWATHLFVANPEGDRSLRSSNGIPAEAQRKAIEAWRDAGGGEMADFASARQQIFSTFRAASSGDPQALAQMQRFAEVVAKEPALGLHGVPNVSDLILAQRGDRAAIARLRMLRNTHEQPAQQPRLGKGGLKAISFLSFHPPLKKRAKRLAKMGAHLAAPARKRSMLMLVLGAIFYPILGILLVTAGVVILLVIAMMIGLNLVFLTLWLTVIHWAFAQDWGSNIQGLMDFVQQVIAAFNRRR